MKNLFVIFAILLTAFRAMAAVQVPGVIQPAGSFAVVDVSNVSNAASAAITNGLVSTNQLNAAIALTVTNNQPLSSLQVVSNVASLVSGVVQNTYSNCVLNLSAGDVLLRDNQGDAFGGYSGGANQGYSFVQDSTGDQLIVSNRNVFSSTPITATFSNVVATGGSFVGSGSGLTGVPYYAVGSAPTIISFANNQNSLEIGTTVTSTLLTWALGGGAITNQTLDNSIGSVPLNLSSYTNSSSYTTARTYTLTTTDGHTTNTATTSINFYSKEYWGASSQTSSTISDAQIIALSGSQFATSRQMTQNIATSGNYMFVCFPASFGTVTQFIVGGFTESPSAWNLTTRNFVNASGATVSYNIYQHQNATSTTFQVIVQ